MGSLANIPSTEKDPLKVATAIRQAIEKLNGAVPASTTDNAAARFDSTAGKLQNSALIIADTTAALSRSGGGGVPVQGTNTNDSAAAGDIGQFISSTVASGSAVSLSTGAAATIASISLTAGDWDVSATGYTNPSLGNASDIRVGLSLTTNTLPTFAAGDSNLNIRAVANQGTTVLTAGPWRVSLNATTTVYFVGSVTFASGTAAMHGTIRARRVR